MRANVVHPEVLASQVDELLERANLEDLLGDAIDELRRLPCRRHKDCEHCRIIGAYDAQVRASKPSGR